MGDASLLRFLVDLRGEDTSNKQLRDDLMTMLVAGHETTAAVLTWALFEIAQNPEIQAKLQKGACMRVCSLVASRMLQDVRSYGPCTHR